MNNFIYSLILLGHGFKPFGYAIVDELFPFFMKFSKIKINFVSVFIILISTIIFFQSVKGLMINLSDYLYKFHNNLRCLTISILKSLSIFFI